MMKTKAFHRLKSCKKICYVQPRHSYVNTTPILFFENIFSIKHECTYTRFAWACPFCCLRSTEQGMPARLSFNYNAKISIQKREYEYIMYSL